MNANLRKNLIGVGCVALQPLLLNVVSIPVTAIIIRRLGGIAYGHWSIAASLIATVSVLTNLGLRGTFVRGISQNPAIAPEATADQLGIRLLLSLLASAAAVTMCLALRYPAVVVECTAVAAVGVLLNALGSVGWDVLQAEGQLPTVAGINLFAGLVLTASSVIVIFSRLGPVSLMIAYQVGPLLTTILILHVVRSRCFAIRVSINLRRQWQMLKLARFFGLQQCASAVSANTAALLLPKLVGADAFGYFAAGTLVCTRLIVIPDALGTVFYPAIAQAHMRGRAELRREVLRALACVLVSCIPIALAGTLLAPLIARILFPTDWKVCQHVMQITIWAVPAMGVDCLVVYAMNAIGKDAVSASGSLVASVINVILTVVLVLWGGLIGGCYAVILRYGVRAALLFPAFMRNVLRLEFEASTPPLSSRTVVAAAAVDL